MDILLYILTGLLIIGLLILVSFIIDRAFLPSQMGSGTISGKGFREEYTQTLMVYNPALKIMTPTFIFHPDEWTLWISKNGRETDVSVSEPTYNKMKNGDYIQIEYCMGRIYNKFYIKSITV